MNVFIRNAKFNVTALNALVVSNYIVVKCISLWSNYFQSIRIVIFLCFGSSLFHRTLLHFRLPALTYLSRWFITHEHSIPLLAHEIQLKTVASKILNNSVQVEYILETSQTISANLNFQNHPDGGWDIMGLLERPARPTLPPPLPQAAILSRDGVALGGVSNGS
jgi:hypothetical protein